MTHIAEHRVDCPDHALVVWPLRRDVLFEFLDERSGGFLFDFSWRFSQVVSCFRILSQQLLVNSNPKRNVTDPR